MLVAARENEVPKASTKAPFVLPQPASHVHTTLLHYLQAFQRNEDPGQELIRDSRSTLSDHSTGDTFTDIHRPPVISTSEPHSILYGPIDIGNDWPQANVSLFTFNPADINAPLPLEAIQTDTAAAGQDDAFLDQLHLAPPGLSNGAAFGATDGNLSVFQEFFGDQLPAFDNSGPDQGWESFLSS